MLNLQMPRKHLQHRIFYGGTKKKEKNMLKLIESELSERMIRSHMSTQTISRLSGIPEDQIGKIARRYMILTFPQKLIMIYQIFLINLATVVNNILKIRPFFKGRIFLVFYNYQYFFVCADLRC